MTEIVGEPVGRLRARVHDLLEAPPEGHRARTWVQFGLLFLIIASTVALVLETVPSMGPESRRLFEWIEVLTIAMFTVEYLTRVWSCSASPEYADGIRGRIRYILTPYALVDLVAIAPFYLAMLPFDLRFLRLIRLLRLLRMAKLVRYSDALTLIGRVAVAKRYELIVTLFLGAILLIIAAAAMYVAENESQPDLFSSIPATMWWAVTTLTTVGYGDMAPVTSIGRVIGAIIAILGIGMFALPTGILGASFVDEIQNRKMEALDDRCPTCGQPRQRNGADGD